jgi:thioester reductase-like protein
MPNDTRLPITGKVLLTGATGFLGVHLLAELLERSDASVTCIVRGEDPESAHRNLHAKLRWYFPELDLAASEGRVRVFLGDVSARQLGLRSRAYDELSESISLIINAAGSVSHVGREEDFFRINTDSVGVLIELARRTSPKQLHHVSTVGITGHFEQEPTLQAFSEEQLEEGQSFPNAYSESKYRAEVLLRRAFAEGLSGAAYRVGFIGPHSITGRFQQNIQQNYTALYVRGCVRLGFAPYLPKTLIELTPVDSVARALLTLAGANTGPATYHLETPNPVSQYDVIRALHAAGYPIRLLDIEEFIEKAPRISQDEQSLATLLAGIDAAKTFSVPLDSRATQTELTRLGYQYPTPTSRWLDGFIRHSIQVGFIEAPRHYNLAQTPIELLPAPR